MGLLAGSSLAFPSCPNPHLRSNMHNQPGALCPCALIQSSPCPLASTSEETERGGSERGQLQSSAAAAPRFWRGRERERERERERGVDQIWVCLATAASQPPPRSQPALYAKKQKSRVEEKGVATAAAAAALMATATTTMMMVAMFFSFCENPALATPPPPPPPVCFSPLQESGFFLGPSPSQIESVELCVE